MSFGTGLRVVRAVSHRRAKVLGVVIGLVLPAILVSQMLPATTFAAPAPVDPSPASTQANANALARLQRLFKGEQRVAAQEQRRLHRAARVKSSIQKRIDTRRANGQNTTAIEQALDRFGAAMAKEQSSHDTVAAIIDKHLGFSADGVVSDRTQARHTLITAAKTEREFHRTIQKATRDLRRELRAYQRSHRQSTSPAATPAPSNH